MKNKRITAAVMAAFMAAAFPGAAYAEGPSGTQTTQSGIAYGGPSGTTEEDAARAASLEDNKMEYEELGGLIENYNVDYRNAYSQLANATADLGTARDLREEASDLMLEAGELKSDGLNEDTRELYNSYKETAKELRKQAQKITNTELSSAYQRKLRKSKAQLTVMAQQLMVGYNKALASQEPLNKQVELAQAFLDSTRLQAANGMKTQEDVLAAEQTLKQAENGAAQLNAKLQSTRQNLQIVTGWNHDAEPEICPIPEPDTARIAAMNPQNDLQTAIGANYDLYDIRSASAAGSSARGVKKRNVAQAEQDLASTLQSFYASVIAGQQAYEGAETEFEAASQIMAGADRKKAADMMGRLEYLQAESDYLSAKSARESARLDLFSAIEMYDWALKGLVVSGGGNG